MLHVDITRNGYTWVGVSVQPIGITGGPDQSVSYFDLKSW